MRIGASGEFMWIKKWPFGLHEGLLHSIVLRDVSGIVWEQYSCPTPQSSQVIDKILYIKWWIKVTFHARIAYVGVSFVSA
jgi:hypothetical protein